MGTSLKALVAQEPDALYRLQRWGGLSEDSLNELLSWSGTSAGGAQILFRDEIIPAKAMRSSVLRGCPLCLREDAAEGANHLKHLYIRGDWQFREVQSCVRHATPLVPIWDIPGRVDRYDVGVNFRSILSDLDEGRLNAPKKEVTDYDQWLDLRLGTGTDETFLKDKGLFASTQFCRRLGNELVPDRPEFAHQAGFATACQGEDGILDALDRLVARAGGALTEARQAYGPLYSYLSPHQTPDPSFDPFRDILRRHILKNWQFPAGGSVLGWDLPERRLHSVVSFARDCRIGQPLAKRFLIDAGVISASDNRPDSRTIFEAQRVSGLAADVRSMVGLKEMCTAMGATRSELFALRDNGILKLRFPNLELTNQWRVADGLALVNELSALAVTVPAQDTN